MDYSCLKLNESFALAIRKAMLATITQVTNAASPNMPTQVRNTARPEKWQPFVPIYFQLDKERGSYF